MEDTDESVVKAFVHKMLCSMFMIVISLHVLVLSGSPGSGGIASSCLRCLRHSSCQGGDSGHISL